jgi:hypothetical protein
MHTPIRRFYVPLAAAALLIESGSLARADDKPTQWSISKHRGSQKEPRAKPPRRKIDGERREVTIRTARPHRWPFG